MKKAILSILLFVAINSFAQHKITELKDENGAIIQYTIETPKIVSSFRDPGFTMSFVWTIMQDRQYMQITIPESFYRRVNKGDKVKFVFADHSVMTMNVITNQKGRLGKDKWAEIIPWYDLSFVLDLPESFLQKLRHTPLKKLYFICKGYTDDMSADYASFADPLQNWEKRMYARRAAKDQTFPRTKIDDKGVSQMQKAVEAFLAFRQQNNPGQTINRRP